jgi:hypothetical protein
VAETCCEKSIIRNTTVASAGKTYIVYMIYMYATQQDAPHRNKVHTYILWHVGTQATEFGLVLEAEILETGPAN